MASTSQQKTTSVKLPYFHRTLSPEDSALIGDITPKAITTSAPLENKSGKISDGSAWNSAKTWEERDCSTWARETLKTVLSNNLVEVKNDVYYLKFISFSDIKGDAQITHIRGSARFMYELSFSSTFSLKENKSGKQYEGKLSIADLINDQLDDVDISVESWTAGKAPPNSDLKAAKAFLTGSAIKQSLKEAIQVFNQKYKEI